jgi:lipid-binding SYLF domain-containing protein
MQRSVMLFVATISMICLTSPGCATAPKTEEARQTLRDEARASLDQLKAADPGLNDVLQNANGYAIFPNAKKGGFIAGAAYGRGEVYEQGKMIGFADIKQGSVGAQIGGQEFRELVVFQTREALHKLKNNDFTFGANASAVIVEKGKAASTEFKNGVAVYVMPIKGAMLEAAIAGQKFTFVPLDVADGDIRESTTRPARTETTETSVETRTTETKP